MDLFCCFRQKVAKPKNLNLQFSARRVRKRARYRRRETKTGSDFNYCSKLNLSAGVEKSLETEKTCCKDKKLQICVSGKDNDLVTSVVKDLIEHLWNMKNFWWLSWKGRKNKTSCEGIYKKFLQITIIFLVIVWWKSL